MTKENKYENVWKLYGEYFGYPKCCIESFDKQNKFTRNQRYVHKRKGFIPCDSCAEKILNNETTIEGLIKDRICSLPYPKTQTNVRYCKLVALIKIRNRDYYIRSLSCF